MASGIYKITSPSGKFYIGSSVDIRRRLHEHRTDMRRGKHCNKALQAAADKYGVKGLKFETIELCAPEVTVEREQFYIDAMKPEYNLLLTAGSCLGHKYSEETRQKVREAATNISEETRRRRSEAAKKQWANRAARDKITAAIKQASNRPETIAKMKQILSSRPPVSEETRRRQSESAKKRGVNRAPMSEEARAKISAARKAYWAEKRKEREQQRTN